MGGFVVTMVYGFSRATGDLDVLEIAPAEVGRSMLELGMQGSPLHKKYKIYRESSHYPSNPWYKAVLRIGVTRRAGCDVTVEDKSAGPDA